MAVYNGSFADNMNFGANGNDQLDVAGKGALNAEPGFPYLSVSPAI